MPPRGASHSARWWDRLGAIPYLGSLFWPERALLGVCLGLLIVDRLAGFVVPALTKFTVDEVIGKSQPNLLAYVALIAALATGTQAIAAWGMHRLLSRMSHRLVHGLRVKLHGHVLRLPLGYHDKNSVGSLVSLIMRYPDGLEIFSGVSLVTI